MRARYLMAVLIVALSPVCARAAEPDVGRKSGWSKGLLPGRSLGRGAIYELRLRVPSEKVEEYVAQYARWFLPVDQQPDSGRKLLSVLSREHGDEYNLVFLYWYESPYKQNYYCQYRKAFFDLHSKAGQFQSAAFEAKYNEALNEFSGGTLTKPVADQKLADTVAALKADCSGSAAEGDLAEDTIRKIDLDLVTLTQADEGTWNFGVDLCALAAIRDKRTVNKDRELNACKDKTTMKAIPYPSTVQRAVDEFYKPK